MVIRRTKLMLKVEGKFQRPLEQLIPEMVNELGLSETAKYMGISKSVLGYWMLKLGIRVHRVALSSDQSVQIVQQDV